MGMLRTTTTALVLAAGFVLAMPTTPATAQACQLYCYHDCWMTPRGRCCGRRCVRQCYAPRYVPPSNYAPSYQYAAPAFPLDPALVGLGVVSIIVVAAAAIAGAAA